MSDTEVLIKAIHDAQASQLEFAITSKARDGDIDKLDCWCELRHYMGRLLSYRQAAEVIWSASVRWPNLFTDFTITPVSSSTPAPRPFGRNEAVTALEIVRNMWRGDENETVFKRTKSQLEEMQFVGIGLNAAINNQVSKSNFRPIVHAEVLVHDHLLRNGINHSSRYWNGWKYIGASKPTCRLCQHYFNAHVDRVRVRQSHQNLYPKWRLPDITARDPNDAKAEEEARLRLLAKIYSMVRDDATRTLSERSSPGKTHDSNTYSTWPEVFTQKSESLRHLSEASGTEDKSEDGRVDTPMGPYAQSEASDPDNDSEDGRVDTPTGPYAQSEAGDPEDSEDDGVSFVDCEMERNFSVLSI